MPKILLRGYLMECAVAALGMENALLEAMENAVNTANKAYRRLVAWQAERIADGVALGCYRCPEGASVFSVAVNEVGLRIACAIQNAHHTEFNFHIEGKILIVENDGKERAYLSADTLPERPRQDKVPHALRHHGGGPCGREGKGIPLAGAVREVPGWGAAWLQPREPKRAVRGTGTPEVPQPAAEGARHSGGKGHEPPALLLWQEPGHPAGKADGIRHVRKETDRLRGHAGSRGV